MIKGKSKGNLIAKAVGTGLLIGTGLAFAFSPIAIKINDSNIKYHTYKAVPEESIESVNPVIFPNGLLPDYDKLTYLEAINATQTPELAQFFLKNYFHYDDSEVKPIPLLLGNFPIAAKVSKGESFKDNYKKKKGVCLDYATCAAALLWDNGYPPLILALKGNSFDHSVFLYKKDNKFGTLGESPMKPIYSTVEDLVKDFPLEYGIQFDEYTIINLNDKFQNLEWINGKVNLQRPIIDKFEKVRY